MMLQQSQNLFNAKLNQDLGAVIYSQAAARMKSNT